MRLTFKHPQDALCARLHVFPHAGLFRRERLVSTLRRYGESPTRSALAEHLFDTERPQTAHDYARPNLSFHSA